MLYVKVTVKLGLGRREVQSEIHLQHTSVQVCIFNSAELTDYVGSRLYTPCIVVGFLGMLKSWPDSN